MLKYDKISRKVAAAQSKYKAAQTDAMVSKNKADKLERVLHDTLHDLRRLSDIITSKAEDLTQRLEILDDNVAQGLNATIYFASGMMAARLAYVDVVLDPQLASQQAKVRIGLYRKFEKALRLFGSKMRGKGLRYDLKGTSHTTFETSKAFELVPFLIIDNAVKYSPSDQTITVGFDDTPNRRVDVTVSSIGPRCHLSLTLLICSEKVIEATAQDAVGQTVRGWACTWSEFCVIWNLLKLVLNVDIRCFH